MPIQTNNIPSLTHIHFGHSPSINDSLSVFLWSVFVDSLDFYSYFYWFRSFLWLFWIPIILFGLGLLLLFFRLFIGIDCCQCCRFDHYFIELELALSSLCYCPSSFDYCSSWHQKYQLSMSIINDLSSMCF